MLELFALFSENYADGVIAITATVALIVSCFTLYKLYSEFSAKHRPYITAIVEAKETDEKDSISVFVSPKNVGPHPCFFKISDIELQIGDEIHTTPSNKEWSLIGSRDVSITMPVGHINQNGIKKIREARYSRNIIELRFTITKATFNKKKISEEKLTYEINVLNEIPLVTTRP